MRSKQVQILSGICGVQLIGYACRAAGFKTDSVRYCIDHYGREANVLALVA